MPTITKEQAAALGRKAQQPKREAGELLAVFVPGPVKNPLNGSHGHWTKRARWAKGWRDKTSQAVLEGVPLYRCSTNGLVLGDVRVIPETPKRVVFLARTHNRMDDDNLRAALKPCRDGLRDMRVIHDDDPRSGHEFVYTQTIDRAHRGVEIRVTLRDTPVEGAQETPHV